MSSSLLEALALAGITGSGKDKKEDDAVTTALKLLKYMRKIETVTKKEEDEKKKKEKEKKDEGFKFPHFSVWQLFILGPPLGFAYLLLFNKLLEATASLLHMH